MWLLLLLGDLLNLDRVPITCLKGDEGVGAFTLPFPSVLFEICDVLKVPKSSGLTLALLNGDGVLNVGFSSSFTTFA